jgi:hypothetical protein
VRQYTPRTASKIAKIFSDENSYSVLHDLGGRHSNDVHYRYITKPLRGWNVDRRETETDEYYDQMLRGIKKDSAEQCKEPSWHALVIHSNFGRPVFAPKKSLPTNN